MAVPSLPPFSTLLKSRDVEDPVNLWLHRPLAYGFVALIFRTPVTPNQVTLLALLVGLSAAACWIEGSRAAMLLGGVLLWTSAILDGADGILARAKQSFSDLGRALDGTADMVVAGATVGAAGYHLAVTPTNPWVLYLLPLAIASAVMHIDLYDFYKESYMTMTNPAWNGEPERVAHVAAMRARLDAEGASWVQRVAASSMLSFVTGQKHLVQLTNPWGVRDHLRFRVDAGSADAYRRFNRGPMRLWAAISLSPHSYTMAICGMFDRLDIYLWIRLVLANVLFVVVLLWQRSASRRALQDLEQRGLAPVPALQP